MMKYYSQQPCNHVVSLSVSEIFPYLVVVIGLENVLVLTKSVVSTPVDLEVKLRIAQGKGWFFYPCGDLQSPKVPTRMVKARQILPCRDISHEDKGYFKVRISARGPPERRSGLTSLG